MNEEKQLIAAFKADLLDRFTNIQIEDAKNWACFLEIRKVIVHDQPGLSLHIARVRISGLRLMAEPGYYRTGMPPLTTPITMDLTDPESLTQLYDFIEACGGTYETYCQ